MTDDFWGRTKKLYNQILTNPNAKPSSVPVQKAPRPIAPTPEVPVQQVEQQSPLTNQDKEALLRDAGSKLLVVELKYDNKIRMVEPYSIKSGIYGRLFYGFDPGRAVDAGHREPHIQSFRVDRIQSIKITNMHYAPRWDVFPDYIE